MSVAQIVFDLPIDGIFDYLIPEGLAVSIGQRVKVSFGHKDLVGFVVGIIEKSAFAQLKPLHALKDTVPVFGGLDLDFACSFSAYYGCSLGEALATLLRNKKDPKPSFRREHKPVFYLYRCVPEHYAVKIQQIIKKYKNPLILVPDSFRALNLSSHFKDIEIGTRSAVFECDGRYDGVVMVDDEDPSFKQEQSPMYETRQVLLTRARMYGFDAAFVGISPSVELMKMVLDRKIEFEQDADGLPAARLIDLSNYKFLPGLISPPVRDSLESALKAGKKSILVLNRKGSYRMTRCVDCGEILKCSHCDTALTFSKGHKKFLCRHCTFSLAGETVCPKCLKPSWRSQGIGVEQLQTEIKKIFPQARVAAFEREKRNFKTIVIPDFDILISTQAVLRFQGKLKAKVAAFIDFDTELNRLEMASAFHAFRLALHVGSMASEVFIQTRNSHHYVLQSLAGPKTRDFYDEELKLRKEWGFSPFGHWIKISWRGRSEKSTLQAAQDVYNELTKEAPEGIVVTPPLADSVGRKRDQFRFNVMMQAQEVKDAVGLIKTTLAKTKRSRVLVTLNVD